MTTPSVPRCGRMDEHERHTYNVGARIANGRPLPAQELICLGVVTTEGGAQCGRCGSIACRCAAELARERHEEWYS